MKSKTSVRESERERELVNIVKEAAGGLAGCTVGEETLGNFGALAFKVYQDGIQVDRFEVSREEMRLKKTAQRSLVRQRLRNLLRWV